MQNKIPSNIAKKVHTISKGTVSSIPSQRSPGIAKQVASVSRSTAGAMKNTVLNTPKQIASTTHKVSSNITNAPKHLASGIRNTTISAPHPTSISPKQIATRNRIMVNHLMRQRRNSVTSNFDISSRSTEHEGQPRKSTSNMSGVLFIVVVILSLLAFLTQSFLLGAFALIVAVLAVKLSQKSPLQGAEDVVITDGIEDNMESRYGEYSCVNCGAKNIGLLPMKCEYCGTTTK